MGAEKELINLAREKIKSFNPEELRNAGLLPTDGSYFPAIYYPPIPMYPESNQDEIFNTYRYEGEKAIAYIHIPFCPSKCVYCHWVTFKNNSAADMDYYLKTLETEMDLYKTKLGMENIFPLSVLIGGGTPTALSPTQMERLLKSFSARLDLRKCLQFSCEAEPGTILGNEGSEKLKIMKDYGINRISLGVQSFDDEMLKKMGRSHTSEDAKKAITNIRRAGFESISIDLIYGFPGSTPERWINTLKTAHALDIDAYQLFRLRVVPHGGKPGAIKDQFDRGSGLFPGLDQIHIMKELGVLISSRNGFSETNRRVFSRGPEHGPLNNYLYCRLYDMLGLGISAWSNLRDRFFVNTGESLEKYYSRISNHELPVARGKIRTADDQKRWALVLPLKGDGVSKKEYTEITGLAINEVFDKKLERLKFFGLLEENDETIRLTEKGVFFADEVVLQFYHPDYLPFPKSAYTDGELNPYNSGAKA